MKVFCKQRQSCNNEQSLGRCQIRTQHWKQRLENRKQDIIKSPENQLFIQSLVNIAHSLNIKVIAEFIETKAQQNVLQSLFVDYYQGYFINKPTDW